MAWIGMLSLLVTVMVAVEGLGAERNFRRSLDGGEPLGARLKPRADTIETLLPPPRHPAVTRAA
jgi:hypothetical protein